MRLETAQGWKKLLPGISSWLETALAWSSPVPKWFPLAPGKCCFLDYTPGWKSRLAGKKPWLEMILGWNKACVNPKNELGHNTSIFQKYTLVKIFAQEKAHPKSTENPEDRQRPIPSVTVPRDKMQARHVC